MRVRPLLSRRCPAAAAAMAVAALVLAAAGCATTRSFRRGERAYAASDVDMAVEYYRQALLGSPENIRYRFALSNSMIVASNNHLRKGDALFLAGEYPLAILEYGKALDFNSANNEARRKKLLAQNKVETLNQEERQKTEIEKIKERAGPIPSEEPQLAPKSGILEISLPTETDVKVLLGILQKESGISFLYDEGFQSKKVFPKLSGTFKEVLDKILMQAKLFYKVVDEKTVIIIPDTPAKRGDYEELVLRTFFLSNAEPEAVEKLLTKTTGIKIVAINGEQNSLTIRDNPRRVEMADRLIRIFDKPRAEILVDIEVMEVNRSRVKEFGIELSQYQVSQVFSPEALVDDAAPPVRGNIFRYLNSSDFLFSLPSVAYKLLQTDSQSHIKAKPQIRVLDQQTVKLNLGDRIPIPTTTFVSRMGEQSAYKDQPITSYTMQDIGILIELTPRIHHDGWITLSMKFELTFLTGRISETMPPTLGNRKVETMIRLQDNETGFLAGLLRDTDRDGLTGFPGVARVPILRDIFSSNTREKEQTDIILTITPRIIKFPEIVEGDLETLWVGTEKDLGLRNGPPPAFRIEEPKKKTEEAKAAAGAPALPAQGAQAITPKKLLLTPSAGPIRAGQPFNLGLAVEGIASIKTLEVELEFDPALLQVTGVSEGAGIAGGGSRANLFKTIDNDKGTLRLLLSLDKPAAAGAELATLKIEPKAAGSAIIRSRRARSSDAENRLFLAADNDLAVTIQK